MKLYKVETRGMKTFYAVAANSHDAYMLGRKDYDRKDWGLSKDREMVSVTLLAEQTDYPNCEARLFLPEEDQS